MFSRPELFTQASSILCSLFHTERKVEENTLVVTGVNRDGYKLIPNSLSSKPKQHQCLHLLKKKVRFSKTLKWNLHLLSPGLPMIEPRAPCLHSSFGFHTKDPLFGSQPAPWTTSPSRRTNSTFSWRKDWRIPGSASVSSDSVLLRSLPSFTNYIKGRVRGLERDIKKSNHKSRNRWSDGSAHFYGRSI